MKGTGGRGGAHLLVLVLALLWPALAFAQPLSAIARITGPAEVQRDGDAVELSMPLTQPVPHRARLLDDPPRVVLDFRRIDWTGLDPAALALPAPLTAIRLGEAGDGWSRMVLELAEPMRIGSFAVQVDTARDSARLILRLEPASADAMAAQARSLAALDAGAAEDAPPADALAAPVLRPPLGMRRAVVVLDPGHGGIDPGAERDGLREADLVLGFARELAEVLRRTGEFDVVLAREADEFVSLEGRVRAARLAEADVFVSLHADALPEGGAAGATVYTLAEEASDAAAAALAERHDRADLLGGGADLSGTDDGVAAALMAIARTETQPRTERLAQSLVAALREAGLRLHRRPHQQAAFSVLKAPDIPSVLLELGFLSSARDQANMRDPAWRARMARAILAGLRAWFDDDAARAALRRR